MAPVGWSLRMGLFEMLLGGSHPWKDPFGLVLVRQSPIGESSWGGFCEVGSIDAYSGVELTGRAYVLVCSG